MSKKLFIHLTKCGGMTIRHSPFLKDKICSAGAWAHKSPQYTQAVLDKMNSTKDHHGFEHARWRDISKSALASVNNQCFAIVRNPWDRVVSRFFFAKKVIQVEKKSPPEYADVSSFEAFLEERHKWGHEKYMWHRAIRGWYPAFDHVSDEKGEKIMCDILSFEHYMEDFMLYFKTFEKPRIRNVTAMNPGKYQDIYSRETIQIVGDWYKKDIDTFGYDFDTGPTKNTFFTH